MRFPLRISSHSNELFVTHVSIMRLVHAVAASIITFACVGAIHAGPIIQPVGSTSGGRQAVTNFQFLAVPFTLTSSFASVEIDASLTAHDAGVPGTAFL